MTFQYYLPDENGNKIEHNTCANSIIIIGANGSGKSKLGAWIECQNMDNIHRIGAQRNLNFNENVPLKSYSQAEDFVFYGTDDKNHKKNKGYRWNWGKEYTTRLMNDFDDVLAALIALKNNENEKYVQACKTISSRENRPDPPDTAIDKLIKIWNEILPQRKLEVVDAKFLASIKDGTETTYNSNQMSDGERAVLYLTAQVLCVPTNKTIIIDEPEVHLHRSIMNRLWTILENSRPDCFFIYITHDTQFAASHKQSDKIWIREYDGTNWKLQKIDDTELPEDLLFDILGNRRNVLFVEGEKNSYDTKLYTILYPNYYVIAYGSCSQVIERTKAFNSTETLHHCQVYGLIDLDYRSEHEIKKYKDHNIFSINVAEIENLFVTEELIRLLAEHLGRDPNIVFSNVKNFVIQTKFANQINKQICNSVVSNLKYKLSSIDLSKMNDDKIRESLNNAIQTINCEEIKSEQIEKFNEALNSQDYKRILQIFNEKGLSGSIGKFFGLENKNYCSTIINLLNGNLHDEITKAIEKYLPTGIPRQITTQA